jgi:hypothetical protein
VLENRVSRGIFGPKMGKEDAVENWVLGNVVIFT